MSWLDLPPLSGLRAFAAFAQTGSVSLASQQLNVTHPAISQQIRALETHLDITLVERAGRGLVLTTEGRILADAVLEGFDTMATAVATLTRDDHTRPLQVSATPSFAAAWLMPRLASFREKHPDLDLMIDPSAAVKELRPGGIDVALRYGDGQWPGLDVQPLVQSPITVVAAPSLVGPDLPDKPSDLNSYPWLQETGTNEATNWLAHQGVKRDAARGLTALPGPLMLEAARQGQGIAITVRVFVEDDIAAGRLQLLFEDDRETGYWVVTRQGAQRPAVRAFLAWLRQVSAKT